MLKYYHAEPLANSLKSMIPLKEKGLTYESVYVDLHKFEQHSDWFVAINPEGQVPVLDYDGAIVTHTTVINEYLEDVFPDDQPASGPLRPRDAVGAARMRYWNKFVDEQVMNYVSMHGWHRMVRVIASSIGVPMRRCGTRPAILPCCSGGMRSSASVRMKPGITQLARMLCGAISTAIARVSPRTPCLLAT